MTSQFGIPPIKLLFERNKPIELGLEVRGTFTRGAGPGGSVLTELTVFGWLKIEPYV